jgi:hypothetical protein
MVRNFHFDNHKAASIARDEGSLAVARQRIQEYKEERDAARNTGMPALLLPPINIIRPPETSSARNSAHIVNFPCQFIKLRRTRDATLIVYRDRLHIVGTKLKKTLVIQFSRVAFILQRPRCHHQTGLNIFMIGGRAYLLDFPQNSSTEILNTFQIPESVMVQRQEAAPFFQSLHYTQKWVEKGLSNFQYLLAVNIFSGRSFNDSSQYPFFPWVLADYESSPLDFSKPETFRDLSKPTGALNPERLEELRQRSRHLCDIGNAKPHLYASFVMSSMSLFLFLIRMEPFTSLHIELQAGRFDHPGRLFESIPETYHFVTSHMNDYRELLPEFFFQPEFLVNENGFDFGLLSSGVRVNDVILPPWASCPVDFVYQMRKALESPAVSERLHLWIDLFFGVSQSDFAADNVYHPDMYATAWTRQALADSQRCAEIEALMTHVGCVPQRLFSSRHPQQKPLVPKRLKALAFSVDRNAKCTVTCAAWRDGLAFVALSGGEIYEVRIDAGEPHSRKIPDKLPAVIALRVGDGSALALIDRHVLFTIKADAIQLVQKESCDVSIVEVSDDVVARVVGGTRLSLSAEKVVKCTIPFYGNMIVCCAISKAFRIAVAGIADGCLVICAIFEGIKVRVISLDRGCVPVDICVTKAWGFIVATVKQTTDGDVTNWIYVWNVNGMFVRKVDIAFEVAAWYTWASNDGFDYMIIADKTGKVYGVEVFYMDLGKPFWEAKKGVGIMAITYVTDGEIAGIIQSDGSVEMKPFSIKNGRMG